MTSGTSREPRRLDAGEPVRSVARRLPAASQLRTRARDARRQEREATRRGWDDVAALYAALADGIERLAGARR